MAPADIWHHKSYKLRMDHHLGLTLSRVAIIDFHVFENSVPEDPGNHVFFNYDSAAWHISANWHANV